MLTNISGYIHISVSSYINNILLFHFFCVYSQYHVVPQATYQMDREATPAPLLGGQSSTPVTEGMR